MTERYTVRTSDWGTDEQGIRAVRQQVFVIGQNVPAELEWDGLDQACKHAVALTETGLIVGTGRVHIQDDAAKIGRMAVLDAHRGRGIGPLLLHQLLNEARHAGIENKRIYLNAQSAVVDFYARYGFNAQGPEFEEAGIPHRRMIFGGNTK